MILCIAIVKSETHCLRNVVFRNYCMQFRVEFFSDCCKQWVEQSWEHISPGKVSFLLIYPCSLICACIYLL